MIAYTDLYIKAPTELEAKAVATALREHGVALIDDEGNWITGSHDHAMTVDVHVVITPAVLDAEGNVTTPDVMEDGWFANLRVVTDQFDIAGLTAIAATFGVVMREPVTPQQVWA